MKTPEQWNKILAPEMASVYARNAVMHAARVHLASLAPEKRIGTEQLVETLYPRTKAERSLTGDNARARIYTVLAKLATDGLEDCCEKGEVNGQFMGKPKRPWLWFSPGDVEICCMCGQIMPQEEV